MNSTTALYSGHVLAAALVAISGLHVYWALGGRWALREALGPVGPDIPPAWLTLFIALCLATAAIIVWGRIGILGNDLPMTWFQRGTWGVCAVLFAVGAGNFISRSSWEIVIIAPLCFVLASLAGYVARVGVGS